MSRANDMVYPLTSHGPNDTVQYGMTMREYYAGVMLPGLLADTAVQGSVDEYARRAVELADALLAALEKPVQS